jgi:lysine 6-dehydrogenase
MKALVLGATGVVGRRAAAELARSEHVDVLFAAGRDDARVAWLADVLGGPGGKVRPLALDVRDVGAMRDAARRVDIVASCAGPSYLLEVPATRAAIEAGVPYVSLCDDHAAAEEVLRFDDDARRAGVTVVSGCGMSPGITNLLIALATSELDAVEEIEVAVAGSAGGPSGSAGEIQLVASLSHEAPVVSDHQPASERGASAPKLVYFPEPVGWVETFRCAHPEVVTFPRRHPELRSMRFRLGLIEKAAMDLVRASVAGGIGRHEATRRLWPALFRPCHWLFERWPARGAAWASARVDVRGSKARRPSTVSLGLVDQLVNLATLPLANAAVKLGSRAVELPGVHPPEDVFEPRTVLPELGRLGIRLARLEPYPL